MDRGLSIAASGMLAEQVRQDQIANDLANATTPGYKSERSAQRSFGEVLVTTREGVPIGTQVGGVRMDAIASPLSQGLLRETGEPLDLALDGDGFFAVQTDRGVAYTRNGQFGLDAGGRLVTQAGYPVLDASGHPITVASAEELQVGADGTLTVDGREAGRLALVELPAPVKLGDGLFGGAPTGPAGSTTVRQGALEGSDVNATRAIVDMIVSLRAFESSQRVIRAIDDTLGRGINNAGSVRAT